MPWYTNQKTGGKFFVDDGSEKSSQIQANQAQSRALNDEEKLADLYKRMDSAYMNYKTAVSMNTQSKFHTEEQNAKNKQIVNQAKAEYETWRKRYREKKEELENTKANEDFIDSQMNKLEKYGYFYMFNDEIRGGDFAFLDLLERKGLEILENDQVGGFKIGRRRH